MNDALQSLGFAWHGISQLELVSVAFGLAYVVLAARENSWCWPAAFIGTGTAVFLFWDASLVMESALNVYYLGMAIFGWWQWQKGGVKNTKLTIQTLTLRHHLLLVFLITILTIISGYLLSNNSNAALPYVDSFTTWSAVITTWMIARKILENWLYWIIIDSVSIWLYIERDLYLYAALFVIYIIVAIFGYFYWLRTYSKTQQHG
jgi:nicotinamide mononucleotide transporter